LTETLVVTSIIALLAAILIPSTARARAHARTAQCLSNLHQLQASALAYASQYRGYLPAATDPDQPSWAAQLARQVGLRFPGTHPPVEQLRPMHCAERQSGSNASPFVDYVANAMNPRGPAPDGTWSRAAYLRSEGYRRQSSTIYLADAEREDMVVHIPGHPGGVTVKDAHDNWLAQAFDKPTLGAMTVWTGSHLPEGKDCVNVTDEPGVRRVGRKLHPGRFTNAGFLDGHAQSVPPGGWPVDENNYGVWLSRFGVRDSDTVKTLPIQ
jgi:prepilin-type processing-associated H-X9-DG protein